MKILTVIQARRGSSRLPNKVMLPVLGQPLLARMLERVEGSKLKGTVVVATTKEAFDDPIADLCKEFSYDCFRGHSTDLLDRHYQAGMEFQADVVIKIPSDCPLIDPAIIDKVIEYFINNKGKFDFVSNLHPASYPDGNDVEIMPMAILQKGWQEANSQMEREHTTPYFWENPDKFRIGNVSWETGLDYSMSHRWTIDYLEDYHFICKVYEELYPTDKYFTLEAILKLLEASPEIMEINNKFAGVNWYRNHLGELKTIDSSKTRME